MAVAFASAPQEASEPPAQPTAPVTNTALEPVARTEGWARQRHIAQARRLKTLRPRLLFVGDSITQAWEAEGAAVWAEYYGERAAANLGIAGDRCEHVLWRLERLPLADLEPRLAVVMIGTNNSDRNTSEEIAGGVGAIVQQLRTRLPKTHVLLLAIFPRGQHADDPQRLVNDRVNALIQPLGEDEHVTYLDLQLSFLDDEGRVSRRLMPDLLHLSPQAYRLWAEAIEATVAEHVDVAPEAAAAPAKD